MRKRSSERTAEHTAEHTAVHALMAGVVWQEARKKV